MKASCRILFFLLFGIGFLSGCTDQKAGTAPEKAKATVAEVKKSSVPLAKARIDAGTPVRIENPSEATIVIYMHGTARPHRRENCSLPYNQPPPSIQALTKLPDTYIYYICSKATDEGISGSYIYKRVNELEAHLIGLGNAGIRPENIFLSGYSAGAWTALMASYRLSEYFNASIIFAPACCGPRYEFKKFPRWRGAIRPLQIKTMLQAERIDALIFAYEDDPFNRPSELAFLTDKYKNSVEMVSYSCAKGHLTFYKDCQLKNTKSRIKDYIKKRKNL